MSTPRFRLGFDDRVDITTSQVDPSPTFGDESTTTTLVLEAVEGDIRAPGQPRVLGSGTELPTLLANPTALRSRSHFVIATTLRLIALALETPSRLDPETRSALLVAVHRWEDDHPDLDESARRDLLAITNEFGEIFDANERLDPFDSELPPSHLIPRTLEHRDPPIRAWESEARRVIASLRRTSQADAPPMSLTPSPAPSISTYPVAEAPELVAVGVAFELRAALHGEPPWRDAQPLELRRHGGRPVMIDVDVVLPPGITETRGLLRGRLEVDESGCSAELAFELMAGAAGTFVINVRFDREGVVLCTLGVPISVLAHETISIEIASNRTSGHISNAVGLPIGGRTLRLDEISRDGYRRHVRQRLLELRADHEVHEPDPGHMHTIADSAQGQLVELCRRFVTLMKIHDASAKELRLQSIGAMIADALLHRDVVRRLRSLPEGTLLHIEHDDGWAPWEMAFLQDDDGNGVFLGEHFAVTRSMPCSRLITALSVEHSALVVPDPARTGLDPARERAAIEALCGHSPTELSTLKAVQTVLANLGDRYQLLHFVCHGNHEPGRVGEESRLQLDNGEALVLSDVRDRMRLRRRGGLDDALVFINACQAGVGGTPTLSGHGGWAEAFLRHGVGAVIVPSWSIPDVTAANLAERFYENVNEGVPLPEALRRARLATKAEGEPDPLAYALYAHPQARLSVTRARTYPTEKSSPP